MKIVSIDSTPYEGSLSELVSREAPAFVFKTDYRNMPRIAAGEFDRLYESELDLPVDVMNLLIANHGAKYAMIKRDVRKDTYKWEGDFFHIHKDRKPKTITHSDPQKILSYNRAEMAQEEWQRRQSLTENDRLQAFYDHPWSYDRYAVGMDDDEYLARVPEMFFFVEFDDYREEIAALDEIFNDLKGKRYKLECPMPSETPDYKHSAERLARYDEFYQRDKALYMLKQVAYSRGLDEVVNLHGRDVISGYEFYEIVVNDNYPKDYKKRVRQWKKKRKNR